MTDEWVETTLGQSAEITIGRTPPRKEGKYWTDDLTHPFCTIADMDGSVIDPIREGVSEQAIIDGKAKVVPAGSLLMSFKLTIGRVGFAARDLYPNEAIAWIRSTDPLLDERYLGLWLSSQDLTVGSGRAVKGATLNGESLRAIRVHVPPLAVQRRIVDLLAHLDNHLANLQTERETAETAATTLREYLFNGAAEGALMPLAEVADWYSGSTPKAGSPEYYEGGTIPWAVIADVLNGPITETATLITEAGLEKIGRLAPIGAVLVTMYGTIGRVGLARVEMATNQAIAWGVAKSNVLPDYLFHALRQLGPRLDSLGRGATQRNINREILRSQLIRLPELERQQEVVTTLNSLDVSVNALDMEIATAEQLRGAMLSALLTGSLLIPELYDSLLDEVA